jgi:signal transduction histidine kinase
MPRDTPIPQPSSVEARAGDGAIGVAETAGCLSLDRPAPAAAHAWDPATASFFSGLTHQLRNAVFGLTASIDLLEISVPPTPPFANASLTMRQHTARLLRVLAELDAYATAALPPQLDGPLPPLVRDACIAVAPLADERGVAVSQSYSLDPCSVRMEPPNLARAIRSLIETAILRTPPRGGVTLALLDHGDGHAELRIEDEGASLGPNVLPRAHEPFVVRGGDLTGLSFALADRVAHAHGGRLLLEEQPSRGLVTRLLLPLNPVLPQ